MLVDRPAVEHADDLGLGLVDQQMAGDAVAPRDVAVAVGDLARGPLPGAGLRELAAAEALAQDGALVLGDGALDLERELVVGVVGDGALDEGDLAAGLAKFFEEEDLVGVLAGQAVGAVDRQDVEFPRAGGIAEAVQAGAVEPRPRIALVGEDVLRPQFVPSFGGPLT